MYIGWELGYWLTYGNRAEEEAFIEKLYDIFLKAGMTVDYNRFGNPCVKGNNEEEQQFLNKLFKMLNVARKENYKSSTSS